MADESTSLARASCLMFMRAMVNQKPTNLLLDLIQLRSIEAKSIAEAVVSCLKQNGFTDDYCKQNFICFASDGASNMTGKKSGVGKLFLDTFPNLILWHCSNHRLELSVGDVANEVSGINPFKMFMDSLYALYSQSPKNQQALKDCALDLDVVFRKLGRVLGTRWAASSLRAAKAIWQCYPALAAHFASSDHGAHQAKFEGLHSTLVSCTFLRNLSVILDALTEISTLSLSLQSRDVGLADSHHLILQTVKAMEAMVETPGEFVEAAEAAIGEGCFKGVELGSKRVVQINRKQFFNSMANNLRARMFTVSSRRGEKERESSANSTEYINLLKQVDVLNPEKWPSDYETLPRYGETEVMALARRLQVDETASVVGFRLLKARAGRGQVNSGIQPLLDALACIPISTAECERAFSTMNSIVTSKRSKLLVSNVSALMTISILGPPITLFNPKLYACNWLKRGNHGAYDTASVKRKEKTFVSDYTHIYSLL